MTRLPLILILFFSFKVFSKEYVNRDFNLKLTIPDDYTILDTVSITKVIQSVENQVSTDSLEHLKQTILNNDNFSVLYLVDEISLVTRNDNIMDNISISSMSNKVEILNDNQMQEWCTKRLIDLGKISNSIYSKMLKNIFDIFDGYLDIKIFNKENYFLKRAINSSYKAAVTEAKIEIIPISARYYLELIIILLFSLSAFVFLKFQSTDNLVQNLPLIITFGVAAIKLMPTFNTFVRTGNLLRSNKDSIEILFKDFNNFDKINQTKKKLKKNEKILKKDKFNNLTINSLDFSFEKKKILQNINLSINKNDFVGIVGNSGSGKTTLVNLICGVYQDYNGQILINNKNFSDMLEYWKRKISYIPQTPFLTDESIKKNILFDDNKMNKEIFNQSIKKSRLDNFVYQNKSGIEFKIGDKGSKISGGQKQRLLMARSFYHNREIIIFDESTSALDTEIEENIFNDLKKLKGKFTAIFISHNKNLLKFCNKVYELKNKGISLVKNEK